MSTRSVYVDEIFYKPLEIVYVDEIIHRTIFNHVDESLNYTLVIINLQ